jgi:hypothetical protein
MVPIYGHCLGSAVFVLVEAGAAPLSPPKIAHQKVDITLLMTHLSKRIVPRVERGKGVRMGIIISRRRMCADISRPLSVAAAHQQNLLPVAAEATQWPVMMRSHS